MNTFFLPSILLLNYNPRSLWLEDIHSAVTEFPSPFNLKIRDSNALAEFFCCRRPGLGVKSKGGENVR